MIDFASVYEQYSPLVYKYTLRLTQDVMLAENITGDVFAKLIEQASCGNEPSTNLRSYLYQIAYHCIVDNYRKSGNNAPLEVAESIPVWGVTVESVVEDQRKKEAIQYLVLTKLNRFERELIVLRFYERFSVREIARLYEKEENYIKTNVFRAVEKLRKVLL